MIWVVKMVKGKEGFMGRPLVELDSEILYDLESTGMTQKEIARELQVSVPTLARRITKIQEEQPILLQYRTLQSLELTALQSRILSAVTPEKIEEASLKDLISAFKILKEKEHLIEGKPSEIKGLVAYLVEIEREKMAAMKQPRFSEGDVQDGEFIKEEDEELPDL